MNKRITALVLTFLMTLGLFTPVVTLNAQVSEMGGVARHSRPAELENATDVKALDEITDKEEERSFIFVTDESSKLAEKLNEAHEALNANEIAQKGNEYLMSAGFNDAISSALGNLDYNLEVKDKIKDLLGKQKGGLMETLSSIFNGSAREEYDDSDDREFNIVFSGFTMKMTTEEALKVRENIPEVKQIFVDYKYNRPDEKINMYNSSKMVNAPEAWDLGYKGEGRVVSVIDSGADVDHPAMRLTDATKAKYDKQAIDELISKHLLKGQYLNEKFPYGYNFMDHNMDLKDTNADTGMHGMHVSGTVGANADETEAAANSGLRIRGIAPEAQILVMRDFGQDVATTNTSAYIEAIEESIILGADAMNMSLGSMSGSEQGIDLGMDLALQNAKKAGSIVAIAGGNDFYTTWGNDNPRATNPDWGVMGTPGVAESAFTVANYNNDSMVTDASTFIKDENGKEIEVVAKAMDTIDKAVNTGFESMKEYEIVDVGLGNTEADYNGQDVNGRIVLAQRGDGTFADKIKLAQSRGAIAFLLGNNEADKPDYFIIMQTQTPGLIPGYSVTYRNYKLIQKSIADAKAAGKVPMIKINTEKHEMKNPGEFKMNESTSWGPNPSLRLKPEITAPGGEIYSTVNTDGGRYESMTGTSMATPHVAGGIALVNEFLAKQKINIEGEEKHQFIKNIMMATATPILYENVKGFYNSPRVQGAGLMNLEAAVNPYLVTLTDASGKMSNGKAVVEFGSIKDEKLDFNLKLKNYSNKPATYKVHGSAQTDQVKDGKITFEPAKLGEANFAEITVNANSEANFTGVIDLTGKLETAKKNQPNGFFIDGFIFFESQANAEGAKAFANLSVPYLAFYGDWASLPIIDVFADEIQLEEAATGTVWKDNIPFWYQGTDYNDFPGQYFDQWNFTHFYSKWHDGGRMIQGYQAWSDKYLGEFAISPNGDSDKDGMSFHGVFLRNADNLKFEFINEAGEVVKTIAEPYRSTIKKNYYKQKYTEDPVWTWRGEDKNGGQVPDGNYTVKITASAQDNKSSEQTIEKTVYVDRVKPEIKLIDASQDGNSVTIKFKATDDRSGLSWMDVIDFGAATEYGYEEVPGDEKSLIFNARFDNLDADFKLDDNMDKIWIGAMDMAGNYFERTLADIENKGKVT
ncbi:MAG: S8 family serine peptidase, partial [Fenollaria timonensis]